MALKSPHRDWRLDIINPIDVRAIGLDQLMTRLWLRVLHDNKPLLPRANVAQTISELANEIETGSDDRFRGFASHHGAAETWLRADLVKTLRRSPDKFTVARPVHALAARVRSVDKETNDSQGSLVLYSWIDRADSELLEELRGFIDVGPEEDAAVDMATFALALLGSVQPADQHRSETPDPCPPPLCPGQAKTYADDVRRMLAYRNVMPRAAVVEHIRRLSAFHLGLYLLRVFRIVVDIEQTGRRACTDCGLGSTNSRCKYRLELLVDCGEDARSAVAKLAERTWAAEENILARYIRSHLVLKKLHEFGEYLSRTKGVDEPITLEDVAALEQGELLDLYFADRLEKLVEEAGSADAKARMIELSGEYRALGLTPFRTYIALLAHYSERRWFNYHRYLLDSLFAKNTNEGLLRQPLGAPRRRRAAIGATLLETLALVSVVSGQPGSFYTRPLRVDQLIDRLDERYGLLIARPPSHLSNDLGVSRELAVNVERFKGRLRESGLFTDLSDAFLAQLVRPRHHLEGGK